MCVLAKPPNTVSKHSPLILLNSAHPATARLTALFKTGKLPSFSVPLLSLLRKRSENSLRKLRKVQAKISLCVELKVDKVPNALCAAIA